MGYIRRGNRLSVIVSITVIGRVCGGEYAALANCAAGDVAGIVWDCIVNINQSVCNSVIAKGKGQALPGANNIGAGSFSSLTTFTLVLAIALSGAARAVW